MAGGDDGAEAGTEVSGVNGAGAEEGDLEAGAECLRPAAPLGSLATPEATTCGPALPIATGFDPGDDGEPALPLRLPLLRGLLHAAAITMTEPAAATARRPRPRR